MSDKKYEVWVCIGDGAYYSKSDVSSEEASCFEAYLKAVNYGFDDEPVWKWKDGDSVMVREKFFRAYWKRETIA